MGSSGDSRRRKADGLTGGPKPFSIRRASEADRDRLQRDFTAYLAELSALNEAVDPELRLQDEWFTRVDDLHPLIVEREDRLVGFALVMAWRYSRAIGVDADFTLHEFYARPEERGTGLAEAVALNVFRRFQGRWGLEAMPENARALAFWDRVLVPFEATKEVGKQSTVLYRFDSRSHSDSLHRS